MQGGVCTAGAQGGDDAAGTGQRYDAQASALHGLHQLRARVADAGRACVADVGDACALLQQAYDLLGSLLLVVLVQSDELLGRAL